MPALKSRRKARSAENLQPIHPDVLYPLRELASRVGMGKGAFRTARRQGLKVRYAGVTAFVKGADFIAWIEATAKDHR